MDERPGALFYVVRSARFFRCWEKAGGFKPREGGLGSLPALPPSEPCVGQSVSLCTASGLARERHGHESRRHDPSLWISAPTPGSFTGGHGGRLLGVSSMATERCDGNGLGNHLEQEYDEGGAISQLGALMQGLVAGGLVRVGQVFNGVPCRAHQNKGGPQAVRGSRPRANSCRAHQNKGGPQGTAHRFIHHAPPGVVRTCLFPIPGWFFPPPLAVPWAGP